MTRNNHYIRTVITGREFVRGPLLKREAAARYVMASRFDVVSWYRINRKGEQVIVAEKVSQW